MTEQDTDLALKQINRSGFPFQLRVEHEIRSTQAEHHWSVASREHPWKDDSGQGRFIDLVLEYNEIQTVRLVVECKRIKADDARQLRWTFLIPEASPKPTLLTSCLEVENKLTIWDNVSLSPASLQSEFCVLPGDEPRRSPILESLAGEVLESMEGLAQEEINLAASQGYRHLRLFIFSAIVVNAAITVCRFNPSAVKLTTGTVEGKDVEMSSVPFIRFRKSLATEFPTGWQDICGALTRLASDQFL